MGSIIKILIFLALLVAAYFVYETFYGNRTDISSKINNVGQNIENSLTMTENEIEDNTLQTFEQIQNETSDALASAGQSFKNIIK